MTNDEMYVTLWTISKSGFAFPVTTGLQGLCNKLMFPNEEREMWFPTKAHAEEWLRNLRAQQMMQDARMHFLSRGLQLEQESEDYQRMEANLEELAEREVKKHLLVEAIAKQESIQVSDEDAEARIREIAQEHEQSVEKVKADIQKQEDGMDRFKSNLLTRKALDFLLSQAKILDKGK